MHNNIFDPQRFARLIRLDLQTNYRTILVFSAALASVLFLYFLATPVAATRENFHPHLYIALLFLGGFWVTSLAFKELHDSERSYIFFTLPCSNCEKFLSKLLLTSIGYVAALSGGYFLLSIIIRALSTLLIQHYQPLFNPFHHNTIHYIYQYFVWQALVLLGSIYFKKHVLSKIVLTLSCIVIAVALLTFITGVFFFDVDYLIHWHYHYYEPRFMLYGNLVKIIFWLLLAPFCWIITYLRLMEAEVQS